MGQIIFRKLFLLSYIVLLYFRAAPQSPKHTTKCVNTTCHPSFATPKREMILDYRVFKAPYNKILHLGVKRYNDIEHFCTVYFITDNLLITTRHCINNNDLINYIELCLPSIKKDKWIKLDSNEYKIYYYSENFSSRDKDIALIKITDKQKLKLLYEGNFEIADSVLWIKKNMIYQVKTAGFPCDKFSINSRSFDTLVVSSTNTDSIIINDNQTLMGYAMCSCPGDSGAPIWIQTDEHYYIIATSQGSAPGVSGFEDMNSNVGVLINDNIKNWIKSISVSSP
ncbi:MAG: trypsin-like serine peptidase [Chitinophagaceae bacterium]